MPFDPAPLHAFPAILAYAALLAKERWTVQDKIRDPEGKFPYHDSWEKMTAVWDEDLDPQDCDYYVCRVALATELALLCDVTRRPARDALLWLVEQELKAGRATHERGGPPLTWGLFLAACADQGKSFPEDFRDDPEGVYDLVCWLLDTSPLPDGAEPFVPETALPSTSDEGVSSGGIAGCDENSKGQTS